MVDFFSLELLFIVVLVLIVFMFFFYNVMKFTYQKIYNFIKFYIKSLLSMLTGPSQIKQCTCSDVSFMVFIAGMKICLK